MSVQTYANFINGEWVPAASGETFENRSPADTSDLVGRFAASSSADVDRAVASAAEAYTTWRQVPAPKRADILLRAAQLFAERKDRFARDMTREMGKVVAETGGDVQEAIDMAQLMAGEGRRLYGQTTPSELRNKFAMSIRQPVGLCGLITAWNFPIAVPSWKIFPALICGNTVVLKPAEEAPLSAVNFVQTLADAGLPPGVVNLVTGDGAGAGAPLVGHPAIRVVSFTGSTATGRLVNEAAAPSFKKVHLEMGGKNAIIVLDDADLELAVDGCLWGGFGTTGQRCTAASRVIVQKGIYRRFLERFVERARALKVGNGLEPGVQMGPSITEVQLQKVVDYVAIGQREGATLATGGHRLTDRRLGQGLVPRADHLRRRVADDAHRPGGDLRAGRLGDPVRRPRRRRSRSPTASAYGLSGAIYTRDVNAAFTAMRDVESGLFYVNAPTIGAEVHLPFGGIKGTGNGHREAGIAALDVFSEWKSIYVDFSGRLQRAQMDT